RGIRPGMSSDRQSPDRLKTDQRPPPAAPAQSCAVAGWEARRSFASASGVSKDLRERESATIVDGGGTPSLGSSSPAPRGTARAYARKEASVATSSIVFV